MTTAGPKWPNPDELKRDMEEFFAHKYGDKVKLGVIGANPDQAQTAEDGTEAKDAPLDLDFDYLPRDIKKYLDRFVVKQDAAKKVLATAICDHYNHIKRCSVKGPCKEYAKQNIIMLGPTGVGKTYLVRTIADLIGVPFVKADATKFSETGYVGGDVEDLVRELVHKADGNVRLAEYGIIYLDEIDKIATPSNVVGRDVSGGGVQRNLLKLMEETEVSLRTPFDLTSQLQAAMEFQSKGKVSRNVINTRHILFIVSGAFSGLGDVIRRRLGAKAIGFRAAGRGAPTDEDYFGLVRSSDFIEFGFESEFIGRLPVVVNCHELGEDDLFEILKNSEGSIMRQYVNAFDAYGIDLEPTDEGLRRIAQKAYEERTGARSLVGVCERTFREYKYNLPHSPVKGLELTARLVDQPDVVLGEILQKARAERLDEMDHELDLIALNWSQANDIQIHLAPEAARMLSVRTFDGERRLEEVFADIFKDFEHGLNLIRGAKGMEFVVTEEVVRDPKAALDKWIRAYYANNK
ncbi:MAG: AAA family ATPase [Acidobacteriota bacterium]|jgi:endopeptidase Clp ATP-binding regulatory subunit ClpX|nr:AAA family ATPase [Acidobacteriota bacterium]